MQDKFTDKQLLAFANERMKPIIDVCCGSRMFYFDKESPDVIFMDNREIETKLCDGRILKIKPDIVGDFKKIPFADNYFNLVIFDPPHLKSAGRNSWLAKKYGVLPVDWENELTQGFKECMRVLKPNGTLVFKWNETQIKLSEVLKCFHQKPLMGTRTSKNTIFLIFYKTNRKD